MWTRKSRRRSPRRQAGRRSAHATQAKGRSTTQVATTRPRRTLWRRVLMRLRALWRWGAGKLLRRFFGRSEGATTGQGQARIHLLPDQRQHRL
ncbi:MAG TPA: hypothetical protein VK191_10365 [Symbiobacteriaceae bacterium]|nr:hypothetical protein [Symbiobacteriaceae bacterium]